MACYFEPPLREAIHRAKYGSDRRLARWLANTFRTPPLQIDQITAVPLYRSRRWRRGFNQAEELAKSLAEDEALPYLPMLIRTRATVSQTELDREQRIANVKGVFKAQVSQNIIDKTILIVDDVLTTGSTLDACALELKKAGAARVWAATLARHR